ncbi:hypothetical protein GGR56DRAFT_685456 [Xylariaceae sp. FL0804]|nr:hypothetical protein GGR56DRAFT_685456 [Xylariaceae sp. FL0804]
MPNNTATGHGYTDQPSQWTQHDVYTIVIFERLGAALSVAGVLSVFIAFALFKRLRTVPNTFIAFASIANLGASIACLIGYSGVLAGSTSHLCQAQAFMFELFMQSDPWWSFAMAVNVYMVFFFSANPRNFLNYWWAYCCVCYGIPFIPALWLLVFRDDQGQIVYGDATIWCWIGQKSNNLRIYTYYLPIWVCIILSICIYIAVGYYVFKQRNQLRNLSLSNHSPDQPTTRDSGEKDLCTNAAVMGTVNREVIQVTTVNTASERSCESRQGAVDANWFDGPVGSGGGGGGGGDAAYLDSRCPQSPASTPHPFRTVTCITAEPTPRVGLAGRARRALGGCRGKFRNMDPVKLAYLRTSFVFAISVFVTWTPSSINRVHDLLHPRDSSFGLNLASAVVLPLQGVWNAVIFFSTSAAALRAELRAWRDRRAGVPRGRDAADAVRGERERAVELERRFAGPGGGGGGGGARGLHPHQQQQLGHKNHQNQHHHRPRVDDDDDVDDSASDYSTPSTLGGSSSTHQHHHHHHHHHPCGCSGAMRVVRSLRKEIASSEPPAVVVTAPSPATEVEGSVGASSRRSERAAKKKKKMLSQSDSSKQQYM